MTTIDTTEIQNPTETVTQPETVKAPATGRAVASMVLGILGLLLALTFLFGQFGAVLGMIGLPLGFFAARKNKKNGHRRSMALSGIVLSAIAIPLGFATSAALSEGLDNLGDDINTSFVVLDAEWHLESEYTDWANDITATATASDVVDGITTIRVTETGTTNVLATHTVQINDDGTFVILD